ncbi:MAG TPA: hypothetical protein VKK79_19945 [Candidatus Lokiarchaeia archaeon]|nr:hypothetical protein [Candidatus Lokiarchaeia archaeon]
MPKYRKGKRRQVQKELIQIEAAVDRRLMFKSAFITYVIAGVFLVFSLFLNSEMWLPFGVPTSTLIKVANYGIRGGVTVGFFFFMIVAWGNTKELRGGVLEIKEIAILIGLTLVQTFKNGYVFLVGIAGVVLISVYIWLMQQKLES